MVWIRGIRERGGSPPFNSLTFCLFVKLLIPNLSLQNDSLSWIPFCGKVFEALVLWKNYSANNQLCLAWCDPCHGGPPWWLNVVQSRRYGFLLVSCDPIKLQWRLWCTCYGVIQVMHLAWCDPCNGMAAALRDGLMGRWAVCLPYSAVSVIPCACPGRRHIIC